MSLRSTVSRLFVALLCNFAALTATAAAQQPAGAVAVIPRPPASDNINVVEVKDLVKGTLRLQAKVTVTVTSDDPDVAPESQTSTLIVSALPLKDYRLVSPNGKLISESELEKRLKPGTLIVCEVRKKDDPLPRNRTLLRDDVIIWEKEPPKPAQN